MTADVPLRTFPRLALTVLLLVLAAAMYGAAPAQAATVDRVVVIGVPGLQWRDVNPSETPNLWRLAGTGAAAALSVRTATSRSCPIDGWLTVSAGERAMLPGGSCGLPPTPEQQGDGATVPDFGRLREVNAATSFSARPGLLGASVRDTRGCVSAVGAGAALAAADENGWVSRYAPTLDQVRDWTACPLTIVDIDDLARAYVGAGVDPKGRERRVAKGGVRAAVRGADAKVGQVLAALPAGATVLLAGVADTTKTPHLHVALATGPAPGGGRYGSAYLTANSTRQPGLVTLTDLSVTVLAALAIGEPDQVVGSRWRAGRAKPSDPSAAVRELAAKDVATQTVRRLAGPFFISLVAGQLLIYLIATAALRRGGAEGARRPLGVIRVVAVAGGAMPVSTLLVNVVPWWHLPRPTIALAVVLLVFDVAVTALAVTGPWRRHILGPLAFVAGLTFAVIAYDLVAGAGLQVSAFTGYAGGSVVAGRFYGLGNQGFGMFITGTLLGSAGLAQLLLDRGRRQLAVAVAIAIGAVAVAIDAWPTWGADFGGPIALVPGIAVLATLLAGSRLSAAKVALSSAAGLLVVALVALLDSWRDPATQTHLGQFWTKVTRGEAGSTVLRKTGDMLSSLLNVPLTLLSLGAVAFVVLVLMRRPTWGLPALVRTYQLAPALRAGLTGLAVAAAIGFVVNDSGVVIPAIAFAVAVPLTLATSVAALQRPTPPEPQAARSAPTARSGPVPR